MELQESRELFGADAVYPREELDERLPDLLAEAARIFFRLGAHPGLYGDLKGLYGQVRDKNEQVFGILEEIEEGIGEFSGSYSHSSKDA